MAASLSSALLRTQTDRRLTALAAEGSEPAFAAIVERYRKPLQAYCRRLLLDQETAEDVVQQALLSTWQALTTGTAVADVKPWLYRCAHNGALNAMRKSGYRHEELSDALHGHAAPEEDIERRIAVRRTLAGLAALPDLQREALLRTAVEGHSHHDVAVELGLTEGAVRGLIYRARTSMRTAATALTPMPVVTWLATAGTRGSPTAERIAEVVAGGGSAGATALLMKGGATVMTAGALAGGAVVAERTVERADPTPPKAAASAPDRRAPEAPRRAVRVAVAAHPAPPSVQDDNSGPSERSGRGDSSGKGPGTVPVVDDDGSEDRSGPNRGPSRDSGRRGSGGGGDDGDDDNRGSGSSGSGTSGSGDSGSGGSGSGGPGGGGGGSGDSGSGGPGDGGGSGDQGGGGTSGGGGDSGDGGGGQDLPLEMTPAPVEPATTIDSSGSGSGGSDGRMGTQSVTPTAPVEDDGGSSGSGG